VRTDGQTDSHNEANSRNFAKASKTRSVGALYQRFSKLALVHYKIEINKFKIPLIFLYLNKMSDTGKKGVTRGMTYIMLPEILPVRKYRRLMLDIYFLIYVLFYI
jgi:hypothetical protein